MTLPTIGEYLTWQDKVSKWFLWLMENQPTEKEHDWLIEFDDAYHFAFDAMLALAED